MSEVAFIILYGASYGLVLCLIALGLVITMGLMRVVNLAHGAFAAIGGYLAISLMQRAGLPYPAAVAAAVIAVMALGVVAEREETNRLAELGVVFLMFSIGLEFSLTKLKTMRRLVFGLGGAQAGAQDLDVRDAVRDHATFRLHARRASLALEVDRDVDADLLRLHHALHVDVHDGVARRVHLQVLDDRGLLLLTHLQVDDRRVELLVVHQRHELLVVEGNGTGLVVTPVQDCRHFSGMTQAAARTLALAITELGGEFK